jgi:hypothetical protein
MSGLLEKVLEKLDEVLEALQEPRQGNSPPPADPAPTNRKRTRTPDKAKNKAPTLDDVKGKLKEVLDEKGRGVAVSILETFDAAKVGDLEEEQFPDFMQACKEALEGEADNLGVD